MLTYQIFFVDGGVLTVKGTCKMADGVFRFYREDNIIDLLIPV